MTRAQTTAVEEIEFTRGPARRPLPRISDPLLQWATGLQTKQRSIYAGWLSEQGKNPDFDEAMEKAGFQTVQIKHGTGSVVTHFAIPIANLIVIAEGVMSIGQMKTTEDRWGIAFGWRTLEGGRQQSQLRGRAFLRELLEIGYNEPVLFSMRGTITGDMIDALCRQYEVLDAWDAFRKTDNKPPHPAPFYAFSIPIGTGDEVMRGSGSNTKEITPPKAAIPATITREYIDAALCKREWVKLVEGLLDNTLRWSVETSKLIASGDESNGQHEEEAPL